MITLDSQSCKAAIKGLRQVCNGRSTMPVLNNLLIEANQDRFTITANNLDEALVFQQDQLECGIGSMLVPFDVLNNTLKSVGKGTYLTFSADGANGVIRYTVKDHRGEIPFEAISAEEFPPVMSNKGPKVALPDDAVAGILEAQHAASTDENRFILNSVCIERSRIVATDGKQLYSRNSFDMAIEDRVIMPLSKVMKIIKPDVAEIAVDNNRGKLVQGQWIWHFKLVEGTYPNYRQVIPDISNYCTEVTFGGKDTDIILRLPLPKKKELMATIKVHDGHTELCVGKDSIPLDIQTEGPDCQVAFNMAFLIQALKQGFRVMKIKSELDPVVMTDESRMHLFMPLRMDEPKVKARCKAPAAPKARARKPQSIKVPALDQLQAEITAVKDIAKTAINKLSSLQTVVRTAVKERHKEQKEQVRIRKTIRSLQNVEV